MLDYIVMQMILALNAKDKSKDSTVHVINTIGYITCGYLAFLTDFWTAWILQVIWEEVTSLCISITRLFSSSNFVLLNFGLGRVFEFAALPDTECEIISSSVKSLRINKLTELNTEVEFEIISLHSFSS